MAAGRKMGLTCRFGMAMGFGTANLNPMMRGERVACAVWRTSVWDQGMEEVVVGVGVAMMAMSWTGSNFGVQVDRSCLARRMMRTATGWIGVCRED